MPSQSMLTFVLDSAPSLLGQLPHHALGAEATVLSGAGTSATRFLLLDTALQPCLRSDQRSNRYENECCR